jgi:hypothetical protein
MIVKSLFFKKKINNFYFLNKRLLFWKNNLNKLQFFFKYPNSNLILEKKNFSLKKKSNFFFRKWVWELSLGIFFLFFGFFSATSAITIIGSVADWDPLAAAVMLCWIEFFTKIFYNSLKIGYLLKLINSFKIGINLGMFVDAFKLTG